MGFLHLGAMFLWADLVMGVDVLGWVLVLLLGAGCGVLGCLTVAPDMI